MKFISKYIYVFLFSLEQKKNKHILVHFICHQIHVYCIVHIITEIILFKTFIKQSFKCKNTTISKK